MFFDVPFAHAASAPRGDGLERRLLGFDELRRGERPGLALDRLDLGRLDRRRSRAARSARGLNEHLALERADASCCTRRPRRRGSPELRRCGRPWSRAACTARGRARCTSLALSATVSCCHVIATVRSRIDQRARRGEDHVRAPCVLLERRVVLVRDAEVRLVREEHHDEVGRRLELAPVALRRRASSRGREPGVRGRRGVRSRSASSDVSKASRYAVERRLRVDDDVLAAGDAHDEIGSQRSPSSVVAVAWTT